jgi:Na+/proline symporter
MLSMVGIDYAMIGGYLVLLLIVGVWFARKAGADSEAYFLGDNKIPWWALGSSGMSSNLDVAGTMTIVTLLYLFGLHGFFIEMRGGVVLPIAVFLAFMGKYHRRSEVMTTAEWMELRFGTGWQGKLARVTAALTYVVITIGMVVFFLSAMGKFLAVFLPFTELQCQIGILLIAVVYTGASGLYGVVWTDVFQSFLIGAAAIYVAVVAGMEFVANGPQILDNWPGAQWNQALPSWHDEALRVEHGGGVMDYRWFGLFLIFWAAKGLLEGLGGSGGSAYMAQRFYAARSEEDCGKIGMLWTVLFAFRWPMVLGFVILALALGVGQENPETILPKVLMSDYFPVGIRGLVVAAMLAAAMSTFDSTINAGASYLVKDGYQLWKPDASERALTCAGYVASGLIVTIGLVLALQVKSVVGVWVAIVINLFPAFLVPFALRWFWGRLSGCGFSVGVATGFASALVLFFFPGLTGGNEVMTLGTTLVVSLVGCVVGTQLGPAPQLEQVLVFYRKVHPMGWWPSEWKRSRAEEHRQDVKSLGVAVIWQVTTFLLPMLLMLSLWGQAAVTGVVWLGLTAWLLKKFFGKRRI